MCELNKEFYILNCAVHKVNRFALHFFRVTETAKNSNTCSRTNKLDDRSRLNPPFLTTVLEMVGVSDVHALMIQTLFFLKKKKIGLLL